MTGLGALLLVQARRERIVLPVWIAGISFLCFAVASAVTAEFADVAERTSIVVVATTSPAFLFMRGLPDGTSTGAVVFFQGYAFTAVLAALMSTFLVIRHTRADEERGREELITSTPIRRATPLAATLILGMAANLVLALGVFTAFTAAGLPTRGSLTAGFAVGVVGAFFLAVAAVLAQAMPSARGANGAAAGLVGAAYFVRGVGDALGTPDDGLTNVTSAWVSLLSPIGWGQRSRPFTVADAGPLVIMAMAATVLMVGVLWLRSNRDLGESLVPERPGRDRASAGSTSLLGLGWRLQLPTLIGWSMFAALLGGIAGGLGPTVSNVIGGNESLSQLIARLVPGSTGTIIDLFTTALLGIAGVLAAAAGIQTMLRLRTEEAEGRAELLLAAPRTKTQWLGANLIVAAISTVAVSVVAGIAASAGLTMAGIGTDSPGLLVAAAAAHLPAAAIFVAATAVLFATIPRLSIPLAWGLLAAGLVLGQFGELLRLPGWLQDVSPFRHSPAMPVEPFEPVPSLTMTGIAILGALLAGWVVRRRDLII